MYRKTTLILIIIFGCFMAINCAGSELQQSSDRLPGGQPRMAPQTDPNRVGRTRIPEDIQYPGMERFDDKAAIDFKSSDSIDVVAKWFEDTHNVQPRKRDLQSGYKWEIRVRNYTIDVYEYEGSGSHLRYKRDIN